MNFITNRIGKIKAFRNSLREISGELLVHNLQVLKAVCFIQMFIVFMLLVYSKIFNVYFTSLFVCVHTISFFAPLIVLLIVNQIGTRKPALLTFLLYFSMVFTLVVSVYSDAYLKRERYGLIYCLALFILLLLYIDFPERSFIITSISLIAFCLISRHFKTPEYSDKDIFYSISVFLCGNAVNKYIMRFRVRELRLIKLIDGEQNKDPILDVLTPLTFERLVRKNLIIGKTGCMLFLDLDDFDILDEDEKLPGGEEILEEVVNCIHFGFRYPDFVGRYGPDQFLIYMPGANTHFTSARRAFSFNEKVQERFQKYSSFPVTLSIGITEPERSGDSYEKLVERAEKAMHEAKSRGKSCIVCTDSKGREID